MAEKEPKPVDMIATDHFRLSGKDAGAKAAQTIEAGTIMQAVPGMLAIELAANGKARPATKADLDAAKKAAADAQLKGDDTKK